MTPFHPRCRNHLRNCAGGYCYGDGTPASRLFEYPLHETSIIPLPVIRDIDRAEREMYIRPASV